MELRNELAGLHQSLFVSPTPQHFTTQQRPKASWPHPRANLSPQDPVGLHSDQPITTTQQDYKLLHQDNNTASYPDTQHTDRAGSPTPEPHSGHSSPNNGYRPRRSRRGRVRHRQQQQTIIAAEPTETQGTFTSAAPTPLDMRRILLDNNPQEEISSHDLERTNSETQNDTKANGNISDDQQDFVADQITEDREESIVSPPQQLSKRSSSIFVKSLDEENEDSEETGGGPVSWMNEWGLYQAMRLTQIKQRLMRPVERLRQLRGQEPPVMEEEEQWSPNTEELLEGDDEQRTPSNAEEWEGQDNESDELESEMMEDEPNGDERGLFLEGESTQSDGEPDNLRDNCDSQQEEPRDDHSSLRDQRDSRHNQSNADEQTNEH